MTHLETETDLRDWLAHLAESFIAGGWQGEKLLEFDPRGVSRSGGVEGPARPGDAAGRGRNAGRRRRKPR